jgi:hypothetical protein
MPSRVCAPDSVSSSMSPRRDSAVRKPRPLCRNRDTATATSRWSTLPSPRPAALACRPSPRRPTTGRFSSDATTWPVFQQSSGRICFARCNSSLPPRQPRRFRPSCWCVAERQIRRARPLSAPTSRAGIRRVSARDRNDRRADARHPRVGVPAFRPLRSGGASSLTQSARIERIGSDSLRRCQRLGEALCPGSRQRRCSQADVVRWVAPGATARGRGRDRAPPSAVAARPACRSSCSCRERCLRSGTRAARSPCSRIPSSRRRGSGSHRRP